MSSETILAIAGIAVSIMFGVAGIAYAYTTNREKQRLERYTRTHLDALIENIKRTKESAAWAHHHLEKIHGEALELDRSDRVKTILKFASFGKADSLSAERSIGDLLTQALAVREGWFGLGDGGVRENVIPGSTISDLTERPGQSGQLVNQVSRAEERSKE